MLLIIYIQQTKKEEWYSAGYIGYSKYEISSLGNLRNFRTKYVFLEPKNRFKRDRISLINDFGQKRSVLRYRVILSVFECLQISYSPHLQTNHLNCKPYDQRPCNLEWVTALENNIHAAKMGLRSANVCPITLHSVDNKAENISFHSMKAARKVLSAEWKMNCSFSNLSKWCKTKCIVNGYCFMYDCTEKYSEIVRNINDGEIWKIFSQCNEKKHYQVSNYGRVKSVMLNGREKLLKQQCYQLYPQLMLYLNGSGKTYSVHRLVALCFAPNPNNYNFVNHIDSVSANNFASNLEWVKTANEYNPATNIKLRIKRRCVGHFVAKIEQICIQTGNVIKIWNSAREINKELGFLTCQILKCCRGKIKTSMGYKWEFAEISSN